MLRLGYLVKCIECNKWISIFNDVFLLDGWESVSRVCCLEKSHVVGYTSDKEWIEVFGEERHY